MVTKKHSRLCKIARDAIAKQQRNGLTLSQAADEAGVCLATMSRLQKGGNCRSNSRRKIMAWINGGDTTKQMPLPFAGASNGNGNGHDPIEGFEGYEGMVKFVDVVTNLAMKLAKKMVEEQRVS